MRVMPRWLLFLVLSCATMGMSLSARAHPICDFDGDGMSEVALVNINSQGGYDWSAFNPRSGRVKSVLQNFGSPTSKLIPGNWFQSGRAVPAIIDPVSAGVNGRASWTAGSLDYAGGVFVTRDLGRSGDMIINGGDYNGDGITDSLILKRTTGMLGLRVNYFLSSYNGNNLGKERLYKALGSPFRDQNFFFSPDGTSDYLAVLRKGSGPANKVLQLKPFTDTPQAISLGVLPGGFRGPLSIKQGQGRADLIAAYAIRGSKTQVIVKTQQGLTVYKKEVSGGEPVIVGDYFNDPGWEIAIRDGDQFIFLNPRVNTQYLVGNVPGGTVVSCISNQMID